MGILNSDRVVAVFNEEKQEFTVRKAESWEDKAELFTSWIDPSIPPLENVREFLNKRPPRM
jgi:hypothetical protein